MKTTLDPQDSADQAYIAKRLEDAVYTALDGFSLEELAKLTGWESEVVEWVAEELTIKVVGWKSTSVT